MPVDESVPGKVVLGGIGNGGLLVGDGIGEGMDGRPDPCPCPVDVPPDDGAPDVDGGIELCDGLGNSIVGKSRGVLDRQPLSSAIATPTASNRLAIKNGLLLQCSFAALPSTLNPDLFVLRETMSISACSRHQGLFSPLLQRHCLGNKVHFSAMHSVNNLLFGT